MISCYRNYLLPQELIFYLRNENQLIGRDFSVKKDNFLKQSLRQKIVSSWIGNTFMRTTFPSKDLTSPSNANIR